MLDCINEHTIPEKEKKFLEDQKKGNYPCRDSTHNRRMVCGNTDRTESKILRKREARRTQIEKQTSQYIPTLKKCKQTEVPDPVLQRELRTTRNTQPNIEMDTSDDDSDPPDSDYKPKDWRHRQQFKKKKIELASIAQQADRHQQNNTEVARMTTAYSSSMKPENCEKPSVDTLRKRIKRKRLQTRRKQLKETKILNMRCLGFDGRRDLTKVEIELNTSHGKKVREDIKRIEHITVVGYPDTVRLGQFETSGTGKDIAAGLLRLCEERNIKLLDCQIVVCDGCATNTGCNKGAIQFLEKFLGRQLLWNSCRIHATEKPLQHLIKHLDGPTDGPNSWSGPVGKEIVGDLETRPIVNFKKIENPNFPSCPAEVIEDLNTDQKYAYKVCQCVMTGVVSTGFEQQKPGKMCHARWLTTAARITRLYISDISPTDELTRLTSYIINVYMPTWLNIHWHHNIKYASQHLLDEIKLIQKHCGEEDKKIALRIVNINGFHGHPEIVLTCILASSDEHTRQDAVSKVFAIREKRRGEKEEEKKKVGSGKKVSDKKIASKKKVGSGKKVSDKKIASKKKEEIRKLRVPALNFQATKISQLCPWEGASVTEPCITTGLTNEELLKFTETALELPNIPCHSQAVEREVKLTTQSSAAVSGIDNQQGFAFNVVSARKAIP
jgi:hypothetical protein